MILLTAGGAICILLMAFFSERQWGSEERTLYNIPYTYLTEGKLAFPAYGFWYPSSYDRVIVHPPTHYKEIGYLMLWGLPLYYAEAAPTVLCALVALILIATARFPPAIQLGLLAGVIGGVGWVATIGSGDFSFHMRPDAQMAFALLAGFLALAASQAQGWEPKRLFLGSFLVTYGSTVHYPSWCAWMGIAVFLVLAARELTWWKFSARLLIVCLGGCLAGIPYLVLHLLPNRNYLRIYSGYISMAQIVETIRQNFPIYRGMAALMQNSQFPSLLYAWPLKETLALAAPPFLVALALFMWHKPMRALALSILPFTLFLFSIFARKLYPYFYLEGIFELIGIWLFVAWAWMKLSALLPSPWQRLASPVFAVVFLMMFWLCTPELGKVQWKRQRHEFGFLRARAKEIMGPDATIASIHPLWYIAGATRWFDLSNDLLQSLPAIDLRTYLSRFDAVAVLNMAFYGANTGVNEASLYESGVLHLRGFMASRIQPASRWVWLSVRHEQPVSGFFWKNNKLFKFQESQQGQHIAVSVVTPGEIQPFLTTLKPLEYWALDLPKAAGQPTTRFVLTMVVDEQHYNQGSTILATAKPLELIHGNIEPLEPDSLPPPAAEADPIAFPRSYAELLDLTARPSQPGLHAFLDLRPYGNKVTVNSVRDRPHWSHVELASAKSDWLVTAELPSLADGKYYRISFDLEMDAGGLTTYVFHGGDSKPLASLVREIPLKHTFESFVFRCIGGAPTYLVVGADNIFGPAPSRLNISDPKVEEVDFITHATEPRPSGSR